MGYSPTVIDAKELIRLNSHAYDSGAPVPAGWVVIASTFDLESGLKVVAYQNNLDPTRIAVAIAGTQLNIVNAGDPVGTLKTQIGQVVQIGEQGPIWRLLDVVTSILFPTRPLYLAGAIAAFHSLDEYQAKLDTIPWTAALPPLQIDPTRDTADNASALSNAFLSLR